MPVSYKKFKWKDALGNMLVPVAAILFALIVGGILIAVLGMDVAKAYPAMLEFARECKKYVPDVTMTTVHTTITEQDEEKCARICKELGVNYRIREFVPPAK